MHPAAQRVHDVVEAVAELVLDGIKVVAVLAVGLLVAGGVLGLLLIGWRAL